MTSRRRWGVAALPILGLVFSLAAAAASPPLLELRRGDRVVFIGNTFAERLGLFGYLETSLLVALPELELSFRNLAWSADEVALRPRPLNFGDLHYHLEAQGADVVMLFFGANESFRGEEGRARFAADLGRLLDDLARHRYRGDSPPRLLLVSPIPQQRLDLLPDPAERNRELARYRDVMRTTAAAAGVPFLDLFTPMSEAMARASEPLTINGVHLSAVGDWVASRLVIAGLGLAPPPGEVDFAVGDGGLTGDGGSLVEGPARLELLPLAGWRGAGIPAGRRVRLRGLAPGRYSFEESGRVLATASSEEWEAGVEVVGGRLADAGEALRQLVVRKNRLFFDRYRAVNGYYIYGDRREPFGTVSFPPEMMRYDELVDELEAQIRRAARPLEEIRYRLERVAP